MVIRNKQQPVQTPASIPPARPACRQRADSIRRKAQRYTDLSEQTGKQSHDQRKASQKRERAEKEMATLRAEAVQARRLATRIKNLHQPTQAKPKGRIMSTTIADPGQAQRMSRRGSDRPLPTGRQLSFNPLHPSMELPPEHLIRLLGLENKTKRRKKRIVPVATHRSEEKKPGNAIAAGKPATPTRVAAPPASSEKERNTTPPFGERQRNLLATSLIVGVIAGAVLSIFLFWNSPDNAAPTATQTVPAETVNKAVLPLPATKNRRLSATTATLPPPAETNRQGTVKRGNNSASAAAISAEEKRLRNEAENRFTERMLQQELQQETRRELEIPETDSATVNNGGPNTAMPALTEMTPNFTAETNLMMEPGFTTTSPPEPAAMPGKPVEEAAGEELF